MKVLILLSLVVLSTSAVTENGKELLFIQTMWRHGDRSPTETFNSDPYTEDQWTFGGGGWGQLSPIGMRQHFNLGKLLRSKYVTGDLTDGTGYQFLSSVYNAKEIYVRSTDLNRTLISAMSNMLGMYGQNGYGNTVEQDYPNIPGWPVGYVPIPVHTVDYDYDYIGNADATCPRQKKLWAMAETSQELVEFQTRPDVANMLQYLSNVTKQCIDIDNLWVVCDSLLIEQIHKPDLQQKIPWFNLSLYNQMVDINDQVQLYQNGVFNKTLMMNGQNIGIELMKLRGGSIVNDINMHMNIKLQCEGKTTKECKWINQLKQYIYSGHDTTLYAFFSCLGVQSYAVRPHGYPHYSASATMELWRDLNTKDVFFRLMYHKDANSTFEPITKGVTGCNDDFCPLSVYQQLAKIVKPDENMNDWCNVLPTSSTSLYSITSTIVALIIMIQSHF